MWEFTFILNKPCQEHFMEIWIHIITYFNVAHLIPIRLCQFLQFKSNA